MSDIIDKLVEGAGQVISEVDKGGQVQSAISGLRSRMAEADRRRKLNQVKQQIRDLQGQEAQTINALSAQVLAATSGTATSTDAPACPQCGTAVVAGAAFCQTCGAAQPKIAPVLFCVHCGAQLREGPASVPSAARRYPKARARCGSLRTR